MPFHKPVLLNETIALLDPKPGGVFIDATLGGAGHAEQILARTAPNGILIGTDRDPDAVAYATDRLRSFGDRVRIHEANYRDIGSIARAEGRGEVDGVLFDLGLSSHELESGRGFSFQRDEPLDMRMNPSEDTATAWDIVNTYEESELAALIWEFGEERHSRRIAGAIVNRRRHGQIQTTGELVDVIQAAVGSRYRGQRIHPATRTFQALRIAVNDELGAIERGLAAAVDVLKLGGRVCAISFHSLEDRIVKTTFRGLSGRCECPKEAPECICGARELVRVVTKRPIVAGPDEIRENPRSRSAKLRCAEKI
jgi:16S rRNA (cytosine1402-N4)-methyltransferase